MINIKIQLLKQDINYFIFITLLLIIMMSINFLSTDIKLKYK